MRALLGILLLSIGCSSSTTGASDDPSAAPPTEPSAQEDTQTAPGPAGDSADDPAVGPAGDSTTAGACQPADCGPKPDPVRRRCADGSFRSPKLTCEPKDDGCAWNVDLEAARCPDDAETEDDKAGTCQPADCGPKPDLVRRRCADGSFRSPEVTCEPKDDGCAWNVDLEAARCPGDG